MAVNDSVVSDNRLVFVALPHGPAPEAGSAAGGTAIQTPLRLFCLQNHG